MQTTVTWLTGHTTSFYF